MRKLYFIILVIASTFLVGCKETHDYVYMHESNQISSVDIVYTEIFANEIQITVLKEIDQSDIENIISKINAIKFNKYLYVDQASIYDKKAIRITYMNDDYEIITYDAQEIFFDTDQSSRLGRFYCLKTEFDEILSFYVEIE